MKVIFPAQLTKVSSKVDRSYELKFNTRELRGVDAANLLTELMNEGWIVWAPADEMPDETDVPDERPDSMTGQKTQAQRLRGVIYKLWEQGGKKGDFEAYYKTTTERMIEQLKEKLE